tara:strand:- start:656 stop:931 length:276 start_codon:yes stop_codon:yes gene_type:complete
MTAISSAFGQHGSLNHDGHVISQQFSDTNSDTLPEYAEHFGEAECEEVESLNEPRVDRSTYVVVLSSINFRPFNNSYQDIFLSIDLPPLKA